MTGTRAVIAAAALLLGLSACSGEEPQPHMAPPSPTAPSTTGRSAETPPEMPEAAKGTDAAAAEAFVEFYLEMVNYAQRTGDVAGLRNLGLKCNGCDAGISFITEVYGSDGTIDGGDGRVTHPDIGFVGDNHERAIVDCVVVTTRQSVDLPGTKKDKVFPAGEQPIRFMLDPSEDGWVVRSLGAQ